ncbi:MAG TPA: hypothetical protein VFO79_00425 [Xanthomonadales bacterium]|nr:hypothetical protein [Xanthomonadales bacterium]
MSREFDRVQLQAVVAAVLDLHRALLGIEERDYLERNGLDERPPGLLHIVMSHPQFAYLRTLSTLAAELDARLEAKADDPPPQQPADAVIEAALAQPAFRAKLNARIQESPDVAGAYATLRRTIAELVA